MSRTRMRVAATNRLACFLPSCPAMTECLVWWSEMKQTDDKRSRERALRFAADKVLFWHPCGELACRRARSCRGAGLIAPTACARGWRNCD
jgi:hypothetical protein